MKKIFFALILATLCQTTFADDVVITMNSYGPVIVGMTLNEAYEKLGLPSRFKETDDPDAEICNYANPTQNLAFMTEGRMPRVVRIETTNPNAVTSSGIRIGDPISKVKKLLGGNASDERQHYSEDPNDRTIVIVSKDGKMAMRFEINSGVVASIYVGDISKIHYVEGCS